MATPLPRSSPKLFDTCAIFDVRESGFPFLQISWKNAGKNIERHSEAEAKNVEKLSEFAFADIARKDPTDIQYAGVYSFVLTSGDGERQTGFCRRFSVYKGGRGREKTPRVIAIVTSNPWHRFFFDSLVVIERMTREGGWDKTEKILSELANSPIPLPGHSIVLKLPSRRHASSHTQNEVALTRPPLDSPVKDVDVSMLFAKMGVGNILSVFAAVLAEKRCLFIAKDPATVSQCVQAMAALIHPLKWQHIFIPILPRSMMSYVCAPMPFFIGVSKNHIDELKSMPMEEVTFVDLDANKVTTNSTRDGGQRDADSLRESELFTHVLPKEMRDMLYKAVKKIQKSAENQEESIAWVFMEFFLSTLGSYRRFMRVDHSSNTPTPIFDTDRFIASQKGDVQLFLRSLQHSQMFEQFIEQRKMLALQSYPSHTMFEKEVNELSKRFKENDQATSIFDTLIKDRIRIAKSAKDMFKEAFKKTSQFFNKFSLSTSKSSSSASDSSNADHGRGRRGGGRRHHSKDGHSLLEDEDSRSGSIFSPAKRLEEEGCEASTYTEGEDGAARKEEEEDEGSVRHQLARASSSSSFASSLPVSTPSYESAVMALSRRFSFIEHDTIVAALAAAGGDVSEAETALRQLSSGAIIEGSEEDLLSSLASGSDEGRAPAESGEVVVEDLLSMAFEEGPVGRRSTLVTSEEATDENALVRALSGLSASAEESRTLETVTRNTSTSLEDLLSGDGGGGHEHAAVGGEGSKKGDEGGDHIDLLLFNDSPSLGGAASPAATALPAMEPNPSLPPPLAPSASSLPSRGIGGMQKLGQGGGKQQQEKEKKKSSDVFGDLKW